LGYVAQKQSFSQWKQSYCMIHLEPLSESLPITMKPASRAVMAVALLNDSPIVAFYDHSTQGCLERVIMINDIVEIRNCKHLLRHCIKIKVNRKYSASKKDQMVYLGFENANERNQWSMKLTSAFGRVADLQQEKQEWKSAMKARHHDLVVFLNDEADVVPTIQKQRTRTDQSSNTIPFQEDSSKNEESQIKQMYNDLSLYVMEQDEKINSLQAKLVKSINDREQLVSGFQKQEMAWRLLLKKQNEMNSKNNEASVDTKECIQGNTSSKTDARRSLPVPTRVNLGDLIKDAKYLLK